MAHRTARARNRRRSGRLVLPEINWRVAQDVGSVLAVAAGGVAAMALFFTGGALTGPLNAYLRAGFGWMAFLPPAWLMALGTISIWSSVHQERRFPRARLTGAALASLGLVGAVHMLPIGPEESMARAAAGLGGGLAGHWVSQALIAALGAGAAALVLIAAVAGGLLLAFQVTLEQVAAVLSAGGRFVGARALVLYRYVLRPTFRVSTPRVQSGPSLGHRITRLIRRPRRKELSEPTPAPAHLRGPREAGGDGNRRAGWKLPPITLFEPTTEAELSQADIRQRVRIIEETLESFGIQGKVIEVNQGPTITQFGYEPAPGVAVNRILARSSDLALRLGASPVRLEAPVPGKRVVGIEVPNATASLVNIRELLESDQFHRVRSKMRLALGRDVSGIPVVGDLARMPHLLIAGATGSGKSVCINGIISSLLYQTTPDELQFLMVDPKMVELIGYEGIPHLRMPVVTEMDRVVGILKWAVREMEHRYRLLASKGVRNIAGLNASLSGSQGERPLPYLVVVIDELADLMMVAPDEVEKNICRLAQLGRAAGIHLVVATQRPSVDVITGLIKANFTVRIAFSVTSQVDSRVILDMAGAEKLLGRGDMLYMPTDSSKPIRLQGAYVSDSEISRLVSHWKRQGKPQFSPEEVQEVVELSKHRSEAEEDDLYEEAVDLARQMGRVSISVLQRRLGIGYSRAGRLIDMMEQRGIVGPSEDGRAREVLVRENAAEEE